MKNIKLLIALLLSTFSLFTLVVSAQDYPMTNGATTSVCVGNFYDTGGALGNYSPNENITHTFCPDTPGDCLWFDFSAYNSEFNPIPIIGGPVDYLNIYDGNSTAAPLLQTFSGDFGAFTVPTASTNGCITFEFISNGNNQFAGWAAAISCIPCPQPQNVSQQDCSGSIAVCQSTYFQPNSYTGIGGAINEVNDGFSCLDDGEQNGVWYNFTVEQSGDLSFLIYPLSGSDDYDWAIYDLTNAHCTDIFPNNGLAPEISCNYSNSNNGLGGLVNNGITGAYSGAPFNGTGSSAPNTAAPYNASIPVTAGSNYVLYVSNFSASQSGYFLDFSASTAVIFDNNAPEIISMEPVSCFDLDVYVNLSEPILCSSIDKFDVEIIGPYGVPNNVAIADGVGCSSPDDYVDQVRLRIFPRIITSGTYTVTLIGDYIDQCGNIGTGSSFSFYEEIVDVNAGPDITYCEGGSNPVMIGGAPTSLEATPSYTWTSNPPSAMAYLSSATAANPTIIDPSIIPAGNYSYFVEVDNGNCTGPDTLSMLVMNCGCVGPTIDNTSFTDENCGNNDGTAGVTVSGGTGNYFYIWDDANAQTTATATGLPAGSYTVTVTDDAGGGSSAVVHSEDFDGAATWTINTSTGVNGADNNFWAINDNEGGVASGSCGTSGNGNNTLHVTSVFNPPGGAAYDAGGLCGILFCPETNMRSESGDISTVGFSNMTLSFDFIGNGDGLTDNASLLISTNGGVTFNTLTPTLKSLSCGSGQGLWETRSVALPAVTENINNLRIAFNWTNNDDGVGTDPSFAVDNIRITVASTGTPCPVTATITVGNVQGPSISNTGSTPETCGQMDGTATVTVINGTAPYNFNWVNNSAPAVSVSSTNPATGLTAGIYTVTVTNMDGTCPEISTISVSASGGPSIDNISGQAENCGLSDGSATAVVSGGTGPYTFTWVNTGNPGVVVSSTNPATGLQTGNYSLTVTNANGSCPVVSAITVGATGGPIISGVTTTPSVCGGNNGTAFANVSGGITPYTFNWENTANPGVPVSAVNPATGLGFGTYSLTITDASGCPSVTGFNITTTGGLTVSGVPSSNTVTCNGGSDVNIDLTVLGGNSPYVYTWTGPGGPYMTEDLMNVGSGNYAVTVTDALGCTGTTTVGIIDPPVLVVAGMPTPPSCDGSSDGSISAFVFGGLGAYTYMWDNGETTQNITGLPAGVYTLSVTDGIGCTEVIPVILNNPPLFEAIATGEQLPCAGTADGDITLAISNGTAPYQFVWDNGATTQNISGLVDGTYNVTVSDANGCFTTATAAITAPLPLGFITITVTNVSCAGDSDGSVFVSLTGGNLPYSYDWDNAPDSDNPTGLSSGTYVLTVTDNSNCTITTSVTLVDPGGISATATNVQDDFCNNDSGIATVTATGGTIATDYTYFWGPPLSTIFPPQTTATATGLEAGTYIVEVSDDNGCSTTSSVTIGSSSATIVGNPTIVNVGCFGSAGGSIVLNPSGGTAPYTYQWSAGWGTNNSITNAPAGVYIATIYDVNGCTVTESYIVNDPPPPLLIFIDNVDPVSCLGDSDGSISITGGGGIPPYSYAWSHDASLTGTSVSGLTAGTYTVSITGGNGCYHDQSIIVPAPVPVSVQLNQISGISCHGESDGVVSAAALGGQGPYSYFWPTSGETIGTAFNLPPGVNPILVTDANGCTGSSSITLAEPTLLTVATQSTNAPCGGNEGTVTAIASGGIPPYAYDWGMLGTGPTIVNVPLGTYTVFVTDANGCIETGSATVNGPNPVTPVVDTTHDVTCFGDIDGLAYLAVTGGQVPYNFQWDNGEISNPAVFLSAGNHQVTVTDQAGCFAVVTATVGGPDLMIPGIIVDPVSCNGGFDGEATVTMSGGTPPYYYEWNSTPPQYLSTATGLAAGVYVLNVMDDNGCQMVPVNVTVAEPSVPLSVTITGVDPLCYDGSDGLVTANPTGGTAGYTYIWNTGANWQSLVNIGFGNYSVTVTDNMGCQAVANYTLANPLPIQMQVVANGVTCFGDANGMIAIPSANGGAGGPFTYSLDGEFFQTDSIFGGLTPGSYTVYASDIEGCETSQTINVLEPDEIIVDAGEDATIQLGEDYQVMTTVTPLIDSLVYSWQANTNDTLSCIDCPDPTVMPVESIVLQVVVTDTLGCFGIDELLIEVDKNRKVFIPNAFSPNNDGINDLFTIYAGIDVAEIKSFRIFDRWGEKLFDASNFQPNLLNFGWDGTLKGKKLNPSVFIYFAEVEFLDGKIIEYKGDVSLVR